MVQPIDMRKGTLPNRPSGGAGLKPSRFALLLSLLLPAVAQAQFLFTTNNGAVTITGYTNSSATLIIPASLNGYPVTAIGPSAFMDNETITTISLPNTVTNIGTNAFYECPYLTGITVSTGNPVFSSINGVLCNQNQTVLLEYPEDNSAGTYTIPATVTNIAEYAFQACNLGTVNLGTNVVSIGDNAFNGARVTTVNLTNGLVSIGNEAFYDTEVGSISIPATVTNIGAEAFSGGESLGKISVAAANAFYASVSNVLFNASQTSLLQYPPETSTRSYVIPDSVTNIAAGAFYYSTLTNLAFGANVQTIGNSACYVCDALLKLTLDSNLVSIGTNAFVGLNLSSFALPAGVTSIGDEAFLECENVPVITIPAGVTNFGSFVFRSCFALTAINVDPQNPVYTSVGGVMYNKPKTTLVEYPEGNTNTVYTILSGVTNIGDGAFAICQKPTKIIVPNGVTGIGEGAFLGCTALTNLTLPASISSIGMGAFEECNELQSLTLGAGVTAIPDYAFYACFSLTNVNIPSGVTAIGELAFYDTGLSSLTIPASVTSIGELAFVLSYRLSSVYFAGGPPAADASVFSSDSPTIYYLPGTPGWGASYAGLATAPWTLPYPSILGGSPTAMGGQFGFTISWTTNASVVVEACTNLAVPVWEPLQTNSLNNGVCIFADPAADGLPGRFYRVHSQ